MQAFINSQQHQLNAASERINELKKNRRSKQNSISNSKYETSQSIKDLDKLLIEKHDQIEEYQEKLDKAKRQIDVLKIENDGMNLDLDKAELMLEEYYEKI